MVSSPIRPRVISSNSRISGSSSTIRTRAFMARLDQVKIGIDEGFVGMGKTDLETAFSFRISLVEELRLVCLADFPRDVEAKPGALIFRCEKRLENATNVFRNDASAIVYDVQTGSPQGRIEITLQQDMSLAGRLCAMSQGII